MKVNLSTREGSTCVRPPLISILWEPMALLAREVLGTKATHHPYPPLSRKSDWTPPPPSPTEKYVTC